MKHYVTQMAKPTVNFTKNGFAFHKKTNTVWRVVKTYEETKESLVELIGEPLDIPDPDWEDILCFNARMEFTINP